jgi:hypothetical protein
MVWTVRIRRLALALSLAAVAFLASSAARADATGWVHTGGGVLAFHDGPDADLVLAPTMAIDLGVGTTSRAPFILGGLFRVQPVFDHGVDLALMGRFATEGFQKSVVGFALDLGMYQRWWGKQSTGFAGELVLAGPLGLQLSALGEYGSNQSYGFGGVLGLDLARLTIYREHLLDWWPNPQTEPRAKTVGFVW